MKRILVFGLLIWSLTSWLQAETQALKHANSLYAKNKFEAAAKEYENILKTEGVAPELYYNLGNAYYKSNEIGLSILNYERALRLNPTFDDARFNLELAQQKVVDNIIQAPTFFLGRWINYLIQLFSSNQWLYIGFVVFILALISAFLFVFGSSYSLRKTSFYAGIFLLLIAVFSILFSGIRNQQLMNHREAVIMSGAVSVKSSPDKSGTDLFQLHEGTKISIKSTLGNWDEVMLGNGSVGWIEQQNLEVI